LFVDLHDDDFYFRMIEMLPFFLKKGIIKETKKT
jgi:hypothetical protein